MIAQTNVSSPNDSLRQQIRMAEFARDGFAARASFVRQPMIGDRMEYARLDQRVKELRAELAKLESQEPSQ